MSKNTNVNLVINARNRAKRVLTSIGRSLGRISTAVAAVGAATATYFTTRMFSGGLRSAASFEQQIAQIQAVTGATAEEMAALEQAARDAGRTTSFTAEQAAQGLEILSRAGLDAQEAIAALPEVLALAQGQSMEMADAAGLITDTVGIMGMAFEDAGRAADVLSKGASIANTTSQQLGDAISYAGANARDAGLDLEQTVGVLNTLADSGLRGQRAGTALRNILSQLEDPSSRARRELAELGYEGDNLSDALDTMSRAGGDAQSAILAFGTEAGPAVRALVGAGSAGIGEFTDQLRQAEGSAKLAAETMDGPLQGAVRLLGSAWDSLRRYLVEPILEPLNKEIRDLTGAISDAEQSGKLKPVRDAIRDAFVNGAKWVREFIQEMDFKDVVNRTAALFDNLGNTFTNVGNAGKTTATVLTATWETFRAGVAGLGVAISTVANVFTTTTRVVTQGMNRIGLASDDAVAKMRHLEEANTAIREGMERETVAAANKAAEAWARLGNGAKESGDKISGAADKTEEAAHKAGLTAETMAQAGLKWDEATQSYIQSAEDATEAAEKDSRAKRENTEATEDNTRATRENAAAEEERAEVEKIGVGYSQERLDALKESVARTKELTGATQEYAGAVQSSSSATSDAANQSADYATAQENASRRTRSAGEGIRFVNDELIKQAAELVKNETSTRALNDSMRGILESARESRDPLRDQANAYREMADESERNAQSLDQLANTTAQLGASDFYGYQAKLSRINAELATQRANALDAQRGMEEYSRAAESGAISLDQQRRALMDLRDGFDHLDRATLDSLNREIDGITNSLSRLEEQAESTLARLEERLAQQRGDFQEAQRLRNQQEILRIEEEIQQAKLTGNIQAEQTLRNALAVQKQLNEETLKEAAAREKTERSTTGQNSTKTSSSQPRTESVRTVNVNLGGRSVQVLEGSEQDLLDALEQAQGTAQ